MFKHALYGDGIHDDTSAIQERIDSGVCELFLPVPEKRYIISKPLVIPSNFKLKLPRYAEIKLADGANCLMLRNQMKYKPANRHREFLTSRHKKFFNFYNLYSPDAEDTCHDFEIEGGIWNFNNINQRPNPIFTNDVRDDGYSGFIMLFYNAKNFRLSNLTLKDPANFAVTIDSGSYFTIENITFDFNFGNPIASNMDGIHLNGNCHYGSIKNLKGACYDDLVALNAYEGSGGDISNIEIDGIFAENCHSAVRLLTVNQKVEHITISNVFGTYYQYCIGFTKFHPGETTGYFDAISLQNIHASKSERLPIQEAHMGDKNYHFPLIWIQEETRVRQLSIDHLHRREFVNPIDTIKIDENTMVENLKLCDISVECYTDQECLTLKNCGHVKKLYLSDVSAEKIVNKGIIENLID